MPPTYIVDGGLGQTPPQRVFQVPNQYATIQAAINAAAALAPTATSNALIQIAPGTYTENLTLARYVNLAAIDSAAGVVEGHSVVVSGTAGFVSPADTTSNVIAINGIKFTGVVTFNTSAKTGGFDSLICNNVMFNAALTLTGRAAAIGSDSVRLLNCRPTTSTWTDMAVICTGIVAAGTITCAGAGTITSQCGSRWNTVTLSGTATINSDSGGGFAGTLTAGDGTSAEIRKCRHTTLAVSGTGAINRDVLNGTTGALSAGAGQTVTFTVPFKDANYKVHLTQTAGAATLVPYVTAKAAGNFTLTVPTDGATYDYTVVHD